MSDASDITSATLDGVGYGVGGIAGLILVLILGYVFYKKGDDISPFFTPFVAFLFGIANFIPFGVMIFGIIMDVMAQEFRYSITTIMGILTIWANYLLGKSLEGFFGSPTVTGGAYLNQLRELGWCTIPGMESFESKFTPMTIVVTTAIAVYYIAFAAINRPASQNISIGVGFPLIILAQLAVFGLSDCASYYIPLSGSGIVGNILASLAFGGIMGGVAVSTVQFAYQSKSPFANIMNGPAAGATSGGLQAKNPMGNSGGLGSAPPTGGTCSPIEGGDEDAMVCEAYRNGQLVTESLT
jgi:hypothetical protein